MPADVALRGQWEERNIGDDPSLGSSDSDDELCNNNDDSISKERERKEREIKTDKGSGENGREKGKSIKTFYFPSS